MNAFRRLKDIATVHLPLLAKVELLRRFPSLYGRVRIKPTNAWLNPTDNCNMRCIMCNQWRVTKTDELTLDEWKDVIRQLHAEGITKIGVNGGEPLLRKDLAEMFREASSRGMDIALITSGFLLDDKRMDSLLDAGLKHVTLSIDGVGAEYEKIRGREWARVEKAADILADRYKRGLVDANIGFVIMKDTLNHLGGVQALCRGVGLPLTFSLVDSTPFFFQIPENEQSAQNSNWVGPNERPRLADVQRSLVEMKTEQPHSVVGTYAMIDHFPAYFADPLQAAIPCTVSQVRVMINSHGEVYGGCWSMGSWGCLRQQPLRQILDSKKYRDAHKGMFYKECPGCSCGFGTNLRYSLPLTVREKLYNLVPPLRKRIYAWARPAAQPPAETAAPRS